MTNAPHQHRWADPQRRDSPLKTNRTFFRTGPDSRGATKTRCSKCQKVGSKLTLPEGYQSMQEIPVRSQLVHRSFPGHIWVEGDHSETSFDSKMFGPVSRRFFQFLKWAERRTLEQRRVAHFKRWLTARCRKKKAIRKWLANAFKFGASLLRPNRTLSWSSEVALAVRRINALLLSR